MNTTTAPAAAIPAAATVAAAPVRAAARGPGTPRPANRRHRAGTSSNSGPARVSADGVTASASPDASAAPDVQSPARPPGRATARSAQHRAAVTASAANGSGRTPRFSGSHHASNATPSVPRTHARRCRRGSTAGSATRDSSNHTAIPARTDGTRSPSGPTPAPASAWTIRITRVYGASDALPQR
ncbi:MULTISPECIES: hypothetical protein [unclassified Pseudonocardia]|uniref:hypothetical protein n=1 Tax=Pseudonocardia sp. Ae150A_Ps1 TaxID=1885028 RepID=UPI001481E2CF|nr:MULTISPECIES: hypothetical protein [unclassified Pseudonocardia]